MNRGFATRASTETSCKSGRAPECTCTCTRLRLLCEAAGNRAEKPKGRVWNFTPLQKRCPSLLARLWQSELEVHDRRQDRMTGDDGRDVPPRESRLGCAEHGGPGDELEGREHHEREAVEARGALVRVEPLVQQRRHQGDVRDAQGGVGGCRGDGAVAAAVCAAGLARGRRRRRRRRRR